MSTRTKIAIKMSKISNKTKEDMAKDYSISSDSSTEDESMDDEPREETPDLYRNSALGMYGGVSYSYFSIKFTFHHDLGDGRRAIFRR